MKKIEKIDYQLFVKNLTKEQESNARKLVIDIRNKGDRPITDLIEENFEDFGLRSKFGMFLNNYSDFAHKSHLYSGLINLENFHGKTNQEIALFVEAQLNLVTKGERIEN